MPIMAINTPFSIDQESHNARDQQVNLHLAPSHGRVTPLTRAYIYIYVCIFSLSLLILSTTPLLTLLLSPSNRKASFLLISHTLSHHLFTTQTCFLNKSHKPYMYSLSNLFISMFNPIVRNLGFLFHLSVMC